MSNKISKNNFEYNNPKRHIVANNGNNGNILRNLFKYVSEINSKYVVNLNPLEIDKEIYVMKCCDTSIVNDFINKNNLKTRDKIFIEPSKNFVMALIPNTSKFFVSTFCCKITMSDIHQKFSNYGLALEGCINIQPITMLPFHYKGHEFGTDNMIETSGPKFLTPTEAAYLVIDNHNIIKIMNTDELKSYVPKGINIQYIEGLRIYNKGEPFDGDFGNNFNSMKNIIIKNKKDETIIPGENISINYENFTIKINDKVYKFSEVPDNMQFIIPVLFVPISLLIIAIDMDDNIFIIHTDKNDFFSLFIFLNLLNCRDAMCICLSDQTPCNIIWKQNGNNTYNKTDFIGHPEVLISNVITFSG